MDGLGNKNLIEVIMATLMTCGGLTREKVAIFFNVLVKMGLLFFKGETQVSQNK